MIALGLSLSHERESPLGSARRAC